MILKRRVQERTTFVACDLRQCNRVLARNHWFERKLTNKLEAERRQMIQLEFVCRMRWMVFLLTSSVLACFTLTVADQYYTPTYSDPYTPQYALRRQGFDLFGDGGSLGIIGVGAIAGIIAGGVAVGQAANARTTIQNDINTLSTRANTLQTSAETVTNTLMTAQADATTNNVEANAVCNFLSTVAMVTTMTGNADDNMDAITSILDAATAVTCEP